MSEGAPWLCKHSKEMKNMSAAPSEGAYWLCKHKCCPWGPKDCMHSRPHKKNERCTGESSCPKCVEITDEEATVEVL